MSTMFPPTTTSAEEEALRSQVRAFLTSELPDDGRRPGLGIASDIDADFSRKLGAQGWLGMAIPEDLGGHGRSAVDRFIVVEELMAVGAPVVAHWAADRQTGPALVHFGTPEQQARFLPGIVAGTTFFSLGLSEPDAGSDLASVRTTAVKAEGGWHVTGTKVWTSGAHESHYLTVLCRTGRADDRHEGLSQLLVDLASPGVMIRPITFLDGSHHFNEVVLTDVFVPDALVLGKPGDGWRQMTSELAYERSGPDRFMSVQPVLTAFLRERVPAAGPDERVAEALGHVFARLWAIRQMSLSVARSLDAGTAPAVQAALVKDLGTTFEQETVELLRLTAGVELGMDSDSLFESLLAQATVTAPSFTLRGGTNEVLRGVAAKALRTVGGLGALGDPLVQDTTDRLLAKLATPDAVRAAESAGWAPDLWSALVDSGLHLVGVAESAGGSGGTVSDALSVLRLVGYYAAPVPVAETGLLGGWLAERAGLTVPEGPVSVAQGHGGDEVSLRRTSSGWQFTASLHRVPWAAAAERILLLATDDEGVSHVLSVPRELGATEPRSNLAGEPRESVIFGAVALCDDDVRLAPSDVTADTLRLRGALAKAVLIAGACQAAVDLSVVYAADRVQFGRPIARFQAVQHLLVKAAAEAHLATMAATVAARSLGTPRADVEVAAAKVVAGRAARTVAAAVHQVHGAIGMTQEYELHLRTRRLWAWADEMGSEQSWCARLGATVAAAGADQAWSLMTASS